MISRVKPVGGFIGWLYHTEHLFTQLVAGELVLCTSSAPSPRAIKALVCPSYFTDSSPRYLYMWHVCSVGHNEAAQGGSSTLLLTQ